MLTANYFFGAKGINWENMKQTYPKLVAIVHYWFPENKLPPKPDHFPERIS